jgi:hypothetical protein
MLGPITVPGVTHDQLHLRLPARSAASATPLPPPVSRGVDASTTPSPRTSKLTLPDPPTSASSPTAASKRVHPAGPSSVIVESACAPNPLASPVPPIHSGPPSPPTSSPSLVSRAGREPAEHWEVVRIAAPAEILDRSPTHWPAYRGTGGHWPSVAPELGQRHRGGRGDRRAALKHSCGDVGVATEASRDSYSARSGRSYSVTLTSTESPFAAATSTPLLLSVGETRPARVGVVAIGLRTRVPHLLLVHRARPQR